jgi:alpha-tubulin suppressor-like RCC1 family protein
MLDYKRVLRMSPQVYAWGDNDHGQQGNGTTLVNRKPALVHGLEGIKVFECIAY